MIDFRRFRFSLWPTLMSVPAVLVMLGLGVWQLQRLEWKNELMARIAERTAQEPVGFDRLAHDPAKDEYRRVRLRGSFVHDKELYLAARSRNNNVGFHVVTPFVLTNGMAVLVNRGWVPSERREPEKRAEGQIKGDTDVTAVVRLSQRQGMFQPDNDAGKNVWFFVDVPAMRNAAGVATEVDYWFEADATPNPGGFPIGGQTRIQIPNDHLQYAVTWFVFAATLTVIFLIFSYRRRDKAEGESAP
ncbi:MAG: SURF1 family protein [Reyranellaceae bacterium]